jgi:hypothetical protein
MTRKPHTNRASRQSGRRFAGCRLAAGALALGAILSFVPAANAGAAPLHTSTDMAAAAASSNCPKFADVADPPNIDLAGTAFLEYGLDWWMTVSGLICFNGKDAWENTPLHCSAHFSGAPGTNFDGATIDVTYCAVTYNNTPKLWQNIDVCIHFPPYWVSPSSANAYHEVVWGRYYFTATGQTNNPILETGQSGLLKGASGSSCPAQ